jgi:hypothetical protein
LGESVFVSLYCDNFLCDNCDNFTKRR